MMLSETIEQLATTTQVTGQSHQTAQIYRDKLSHLCDFLGDVPIEDITAADLRRYVAHLQECNLSPSALRIRVRALKRLWDFAEVVGIVKENPARQIKVTRRRGEMREWAETDDILALLEITQESTPLDSRDRAAILFLSDTGCRVGELCGLKVDDLDLDAMQASVTKMGKRARCVFFGESTREALQRWLDVRPSDRGPWVFVSLAGHSKRALTPSSLHQMLKRRGKAAGCKGPVSPRAFRNAFIRSFIVDGCNLETLSRLLGHSSTEVTVSHYAMFETGGAK
jgi:site-specific recombinase XerD